MRVWFTAVVCLAAVRTPRCSGVQVFVNDEWRVTVLFQSVVLPCHYTTVSAQTPVVQWVFKSYCHDRTRDSFGSTDPAGRGPGGLSRVRESSRAHESRRVYGGGSTPAYLDCSDNSRTVRTVASISGSSVTLSEYYKNRDISIINKADLRIGEVKWGDSGLYYCKVVIPDDLEGKNEASVELLVLGFSGEPEDLLPGFDLKIMPEWVFVAVVALGSVLLLMLVGVCWCQCCPHSCCCYVSCWCCPDTCCCPRHLYEAGKGIKSGTASPQIAAYPPYFVAGMPTMLPIAPPSLVDKMSLIPPSDSTLHPSVHGIGVPYSLPSSQDQESLRVLQYVEKQLAHFNPARSTSSHHSCSLSEVSSLHEGDSGFRQAYRNIQKKALPAIPDHDGQPEPQRCRQNRSPEPQRYRDNPPAPQQYRDERDSEPRRYRDEPKPPRRYSDDAPASQTHKATRSQHQRACEQEDSHRRWNPCSEHLQRKTYRMAGRTGSLDELEEFVASHRTTGTRGNPVRDGERRNHGMELWEYPYPSYRDCPPQQCRGEDDSYCDDSSRGNDAHDNHPRGNRKNGRHHISPLSSPKKRRGTWDSERPVPPLPHANSPACSASRDQDYDGTFLAHLLERKAKLRATGPGRSEGDSDTPSKGSSKKSSGESSRHRSPGEGDVLPPYLETEPSQMDDSSPREIPTYTQPPQAPTHSMSNRRDEPRDKSRKVSTLLSRDSLIV